MPVFYIDHPGDIPLQEYDILMLDEVVHRYRIQYIQQEPVSKLSVNHIHSSRPLHTSNSERIVRYEWYPTLFLYCP